MGEYNQNNNHMTPEEKQQFVNLQGDMHETKQLLNTLDEKVDKISDAIIGNPLTRDGGMVARIQRLEDDNKELRRQLDMKHEENRKSIEAIRLEASENKTRTNIMWATLGAAGTGIVAWIISLIFGKK